TLPEEPTAELGEFIGYLIGDGSFNFNRRGTGRVIFCVADDEPTVRERIVSLGKRLFTLEPLPNKKPGDGSTNLYYNSTVLAHWLRHIGVEKISSMDVEVPEIAFRAGRSFALGFLRGLFSADGTISREGYISFSSVSRKLVEGAKELLLSLGVPTRTWVNENRDSAFGKNPLYRLGIITKEGYRVFEADIGFFSPFQNDRMGRVGETPWEFNDLIPYPQKAMASIYDGPGRGCGPGRASLGANRELYRDIQHYLPGVAAPRNLSRSRLADLARKHPEIAKSSLSWFLENDQFYDRVLAVVEDQAFTLDLSVPDNNTYIAAGFISHNTRRGANMGTLRYNHPDIIDFICSKEKEDEITNFNLSVTVSDEFMRKVTGEDPDPEYHLVNPRTGEPHPHPETGEAVKLNAREVFDLIVEKAWAKGDPGIIFIDEMNRFNPTPRIGNYETTNPCVPGDTFVLTAEGPRMVRDLVGKDTVLMINGSPFQTAAGGFFPTGVKPLLAISTKEGYSLRLTGNHLVLKVKKKSRDTLEKEWVAASSLQPGDEIMLHDHREFSGWDGLYGEGEGYLIGLLVGDGTLKADKAVLSAWLEPGISAVMEAAHGAAGALPHRSDFRGWWRVSGRKEYRMSPASLRKLALSLGMGVDKAITPHLETRTSSDFARGFLRGFFDADGSVQGCHEKGISIRLAQSDLERLRAVQRMLGRFGIKCSLYINRREGGKVYFPGGGRGFALYECKPQHELIISGNNLALFDRRIGFHNTAKKKRLASALASYRRKLNRERFTAKVEAITPSAAEAVYDVQVPGVNAFDANGFVAHNCGEQPLLP
ncbi:MAG: hypothetical protein GX881_07255, partial [Firmicutes bacterium]|nr:hypothetical protein [Bacillota bacterium]